MSSHWLVLINLASTWYLVGLIWMVQRVHYNLFDRVGEAAFAQYEADHVNLITPVVGPPMLIELATAVMLLIASPPGIQRSWLIVGLAAVVAIWLSTVFIQVPYHTRLSAAFSHSDYRMLVGTNWIRTLLWTFRGILMTYIAAKLMTAASS